MTKFLLSFVMLASTSTAFASISDDLAQLQGKSTYEQFYSRLEGTWVSGESHVNYTREKDGDIAINGEIVTTDEDGNTYHGLVVGGLRISGQELFALRTDENGNEVAEKINVIATTPSDIETRYDVTENSYYIIHSELLDENTYVSSYQFFEKNADGTVTVTDSGRMVYTRLF